MERQWKIDKKKGQKKCKKEGKKEERKQITEGRVRCKRKEEISRKKPKKWLFNCTGKLHKENVTLIAYVTQLKLTGITRLTRHMMIHNLLCESDKTTQRVKAQTTTAAIQKEKFE